jgi:serine protease
MKKTIVFLLNLAVAMPMMAEGPEDNSKFLRAKGKGIKGQYIVVLRNGVDAGREGVGMAHLHGGRVDKVWNKETLNGVLLSGLNEKAAQAIARSPKVRFVEEDSVMTVDASGNQNNPPSWGIDRVDERDLPLSGSYSWDFDGTGVHAYIVDTGIRASHSNFGGRASADFDAVGDSSFGNDCNGHGTHVAGTVGSATYGVAKNVRLHGVKVLGCTGSGSTSGVISGVDFVRTNRINPAVANMSLGGGVSTALDTAVNNAVNSGVFFAVAAGNNNSNACNFSPARASQAYTVGSTTTSDARSSFSNFGTCVDVFAPGSGITSTWNTSNSATNTISGTSMASPHVAGAAAIILDEDPNRSVATIKSLLNSRASTNKVGNPGSGSPNRLLFTLGDGGGDPGPGPDPNSCVNFCDEQAPGGCWCDDQCVQFGDCCPDKQEVCDGGPNPNSCQGNCGTQAPGGCWCDNLCSSFGDCCADKVLFCG